MTALHTSHEPKLTVPRIVARSASMLGLLATLSARIFAGSGHVPPWRSLDDHLLRDIGATRLDAEIARLEARMGAVETDGLEAIACRGLSAGRFLQRFKSE